MFALAITPIIDMDRRAPTRLRRRTQRQSWRSCVIARLIQQNIRHQTLHFVHAPPFSRHEPKELVDKRVCAFITYVVILPDIHDQNFPAGL
jgi:hypothetical protein